MCQTLAKKEEERGSSGGEEQEEEEGEEKKKKKQEEDKVKVEEDYDEEEFEEVKVPTDCSVLRVERRLLMCDVILSAVQETDYVMSYFDNGEEFGGDSDDTDEAVY